MEAILAVVSLGLAVPGTIIAFAQCGEYIEEKVATFKDAPNVARELGRFGRDLHRGKLKISLELAEWAYSMPDLDPLLRDGIEDHLEQLRSRLRAVESCLTKIFDQKGNVRAFYYTFLGEKKANKLLQSLREWEHDFSNTLSLIEMRNRVLPQALQLTSERFRYRHRSQFTSEKAILIGSAELSRQGSIQETNVLVEQKELQSRDSVNDLQEIARILTDLTTRYTFGGGILKCIGFSTGGTGELVFELPKNSMPPRSLKDIILDDSDVPFAGGRPLDQRLQLAHSICDIVTTVFTSGLVHKSIRTSTILLISQGGQDGNNALAHPYLISWSLVRKATALTSGAIDDTFVTNFYRHPKRQGVQPEDRYNMGHDVYSLGVCLLEIGLWTPLLDMNDTPCLEYRKCAVKLGLASEEDVDSTSKLTAPWMVAQVLPQVAKEHLPQRMGNRYAELTVACLTCLEGGMGDSSCFRKTPSVAAIRFNELVAQSFNLS